MRDLLLFALCCLAAFAFWASSVRRSEEQAALVQAELYQLGAPQTMESSPERSLLLGDFLGGLQDQPSPETYQRLAPLFLLSTNLDNRKVAASAFTTEIMGRVAGKTLEFFDAEGHPLQPRLSTLAAQVTPWEKPLFGSSGTPTLVADGPWLVYQDKVRWAVFRDNEGELQGYVSSKELSVDEDAVLVAGKKSWVWDLGRLAAVSNG